MVNFNGTIVPSSENSLFDNRAFLYGDGVFETLKILDGKVLFVEDHYFRLMAAMRIVRMEIPMNFTLEYFESQLTAAAEANNCLHAARVRMTVYRNSGGFYLPKDNNTSYIVHATILENPMYVLPNIPYEVDLYKDYYVAKQLLSSVKSTNKLINIAGSVFAEENGLQNCLLINDEKNVIEALNGNLFMLSGNQLITPPVIDGCLNGVMRRQILTLARQIENIEVLELSISPFDLQKADELFVTNVIVGIQPITKYRKKEFNAEFAEKLLAKLNAVVRIS